MIVPESCAILDPIAPASRIVLPISTVPLTELKMPPPAWPAELPLNVLLRILSVTALLLMPPALKPAELPLSVLLLTVIVGPPAIAMKMAPPSAKVAELLLSVLLTTVSAP